MNAAPSASTIQAVFFDLDGTLADTAPDLGAALNRLLREEGRAELPMAAIRPQASNGTRALLQLGFGVLPDIDEPGYTELAQRFLAHYAADVCVHTRLFPGVAELLTQLEQRALRWGVVTNKPQRFTEPLLAALNLSTRSACIVSGDTTAQPKPAPDSLLHACQLTGIQPQHCLYVGDDERDIIAGRAAGMTTIAAAWGYLGADNAEAAADIIASWQADASIATPEDLLGLLQNEKTLSRA